MGGVHGDRCATHWRLVELRERLEQIASGAIVDDADAAEAEALFNDLFADMDPGFEAVLIGGIETVLRRLWIPREAAMASDVTDAEGRLAALLAADAFDALDREHFELARMFLAPHDGYQLWSDRAEAGGKSALQQWLDTPARACARAMVVNPHEEAEGERRVVPRRIAGRRERRSRRPPPRPSGQSRFSISTGSISSAGANPHTRP